MKKLIILVIVIILGSLFVTNKFEEETITNSYKLSEAATNQKLIESININVTNAEISVIRGGVKDIKISRTATKNRTDQVNYVSNYWENTIDVKENYQNANSKLTNTNDRLTIMLPDDLTINKVNISTDVGVVNLENLDAEETVVKASDELEYNLLAGKYTLMNVEAPKVDAILQDTEFRENLTYEIDKGNIIANNVLGINEVVKGQGKIKYYSKNSFNINTDFIGEQISIVYSINSKKNYMFRDSGNAVKIKGITEDDLLENTYIYKGNKTDEMQSINVNKNKIKVYKD